jgi:hypothetical protein
MYHGAFIYFIVYFIVIVFYLLYRGIVEPAPPAEDESLNS